MNEFQQSDRLAEDRCEVQDDLFKTSKKQAVVALKRKMEAFENQMATIRAQLEARRELSSSDRNVHLPAVNSSPKATSVTTETPLSVERLKFPLLRRIDYTKAANAPPKDPFVEVENVLHRTITREIYIRDADIVTTKELAAASLTKEAQQLSEEARKRMVAYTQNESGWRFEERTSRYQQVMEVKQQAEKAQQEADLQQATARQMKALLQDPYGELRTTHVSRNVLTPIASSPTTPVLQKNEYEWIWILASLSTKLTFTPRDETPDTVINNEKEISMYVVYYIAASDVNIKRVETTEQWQDVLNSDCPPTSGWMCCSVHGVPPAPELVSMKSGIQTWTVAGAGAGHLNGKYVACGVHDHVRMFKSSAGVELFRKCVPVASSLSQALHSGETARPESACSVTDNDISKNDKSSRSPKEKPKPNVVLPSGLAAIENDEFDFRSMQRVGSWLTRNESNERNRRILASRSANDESIRVSDTPGSPKIDGSSVMNQESRAAPGASDVGESRPQVGMSLCREWVLFGRCSSRRVDKSTSGASEPPMKGIGLGCLKRHYYISFEEKKQMTVWVQTKESWLEKNVLTVIIEREAQMERVHHLSRKCMVNFQQNLRGETEKSKMKLLAELNRVRFLTVKVLESIDRWRQHARKIGFTRYDNSTIQTKNSIDGSSDMSALIVPTSQPPTDAPLLGWSASITLDTGKQLYKGSKAFVSKVKRFRRSEDIIGKREQHIVYLGYYKSQDEAECAYDEHAASEARRLNTTIEHLPHRRSVFRSCGKHFAVESEKDGPSFCIECKTKELASISSTGTDDWIPPFFYGTGVNYIIKMENDLDFLDGVLPLKAALNNGRGVDDEIFPMRGNVFLLPKTPIQDPDLAVFTTFPTPTAPRVGDPFDPPSSNEIDDEALDRDRIFKAQQIFLQELQIYRPELMLDSPSLQDTTKILSGTKTNQEATAPQYRLVEALYWDHCAALKIQQERPPLALRQPNIWCCPDAGEWASLIVRGTHQLHFLFEEKLGKAGKEMMQKRQNVLAALRQLNKVPLYFIPSRANFTELIAAGQQVRGDVVQLEVLNATKRLQRYDSWCTMSLVVQRWFRGVIGRQRARATRKAIRFAYKLRVLFSRQVSTVAKTFYEAEVRAVAVRRAYKIICTPVYTRAVMMDGEPVIVSFHSLRHYQHYCRGISRTKLSVVQSNCCASCAKIFHVKANYQSDQNKFNVFRGVCTCCLNNGSTRDGDNICESWLIRAYNSFHNVIYRLRLETPQLQQLLLSHALSQLSPAPNYRPLIMDMENKRLEAAKTTRYAMFCFKNAENAANNLGNWRRMSSEATQIRKSLMIALEKGLSLLDSTKNAHVASVGNTKKALDFQSRPFSEAQAWDPLENANDWRFIVEKRHLTKRLEEAHQEVERLRVAYFQATYNEQYARAGASKAQDDYSSIWVPLIERENQALEEAILGETSTKTRMESFMEQLCNQFLTLRDGYLVPTRRSLVIQSPLWRDMIPFRIDIPGLRRRLNYVRRRTMVLTNLSKQNRRTRRMVVTVSMWPLVTLGHQSSHTKRDMWVTAYDPVDCSVHNIFLEWELVQLLTGSSGKKIWQDSTQSKRRVWWSIADILLSLTMLDRFTGEFTLQKLQFYHTLRRLSPQYLSSRVMRDLQVGRKCGQGDEVLRQAISVDGRLCVVVVYENWGDLTFSIYHTRSGDFFRLVMPLSRVFDLLGTRPLMLRLWIVCVKSNSYTSTLLVYLLKHVRFYQRDDGVEDVRVEDGVPALKRSKRYQTVLRIQKRQVLVCILEDRAGDFQISGYDVNSDSTYKLLLEREGLHRMLKESCLPINLVPNAQMNLATSSSSLLLRRNRKMLYDWICSRLRFQSLLEHPEMVTSGTSPLFFGIHLRESFRILNRWITFSPRNPVTAVSEAEIIRRASAIDAATFSNLQFDQLSLVTLERLPFDLEKEYAGTMDWVEAVGGSSTHNHTWEKTLPYMRMDFFVKAHTLFARLRGELEVETKARKNRETWAGMENEDHNALCIDMTSSMKSAKEYIMGTWLKLTDLHTAVTKKLDQWQQIHSELRVVTKSVEVVSEHKQLASADLNTARMFQEDSGGVILNFIKLSMPPTSDLSDFISLGVPFNSWCPLLSGACLLQACLTRFELDLKPTLRNLELTFEKIEHSDDSLEKLRLHKRKIAQFCSFLVCQPITCAVSDGDGDDPCTLEGATDTAEVAGFAVIPVELVSTNMVNTGILIPSNNNEQVQEVFLADMPTWTPSPMSPFVDHAQGMVNHVRSFFQRQWRQLLVPGHRFGYRTSPGSGAFTCQRVPYGVLVYQAAIDDAFTRNQPDLLNSRAGALTGGRSIFGPALFWPLQESSDWCQRLLDCAAIYAELGATSEDPDLEEVYLKRSTVVRSTKYLPWKQFAIERLRISQFVKRSRTTEGVCVDSLKSDADEEEKEKLTITTVSIGFRQLEISLGIKSSHAFRNSTNAGKYMKHLFALNQKYSHDNSSSKSKWQVSLNNPRMLGNVLKIFNAEGQFIQIPRIDCGESVFMMEGIQVEIDDVNKPRRLTFSCHELQTQRKYFVDVDYHSLQFLLLQRSQMKGSTEAPLSIPLLDEVKLRRQVVLTSVDEWRKLAALASQFLVFRKKNGLLCLCLELHTSETHRNVGDEAKPLSDEVVNGSEVKTASDECCDSGGETSLQPLEIGKHVANSENSILETSSPALCRPRANMVEERIAVERSTILRFMKHQSAIRAASSDRILARTTTPLNIGERTASEWMQMTLEDWCSQELRGMLLLDGNVLEKLEKAYIPATKSAREYLRSSRKEDDTGGLKLQMNEIVKAMGHSAIELNEVEILQSIRMKRWRRRGKEANAVAKRAEAYLADVAEWWRWRLASMPPEKPEKK